MNHQGKQFLILTIVAGILMLFVGVYDLVFLTTTEKSGFVIALEIVAGLGFLLNAALLIRRRK